MWFSWSFVPVKRVKTLWPAPSEIDASSLPNHSTQYLQTIKIAKFCGEMWTTPDSIDYPEHSSSTASIILQETNRGHVHLPLIMAMFILIFLAVSKLASMDSAIEIQDRKVSGRCGGFWPRSNTTGNLCTTIAIYVLSCILHCVYFYSVSLILSNMIYDHFDFLALTEWTDTSKLWLMRSFYAWHGSFVCIVSSWYVMGGMEVGMNVGYYLVEFQEVLKAPW